MKLHDAKQAPQLDLFSTPIAPQGRNANGGKKRYVQCQAPGCSKPLDPAQIQRMFCCNACRQLAYRRRTKPPPPVLAVHHGNNAAMIAAVAKLYIRDGDTVADVTWGKGTFWRTTNTKRFHLIGSDRIPRAPVMAMDFCQLAYADECLDHLILDPPYMHDPSPRYEHLYAGQATTPNMGHDGIIDLYRQGMTEARRALRRGGLLWVKGKDEIESGRQCWAHVELHDIAIGLGMVGKDKFYLTNPARLLDRRWPNQKHARKNVSFLWLFEKAVA